MVLRLRPVLPMNFLNSSTRPCAALPLPIPSSLTPRNLKTSFCRRLQTLRRLSLSFKVTEPYPAKRWHTQVYCCVSRLTLSHNKIPTLARNSQPKLTDIPLLCCPTARRFPDPCWHDACGSLID